ncbi:hypothetical protein HYALB_00004238 [Hymenoscyphus albidus]|uniref:UBA domain-containing protein n=1 Tax=Hymenoscyphus albidus TaxID=595503 RepID=A0A9N9LLH4_9HELO|nr:hypothetical protein HYALB_00004238 [Hymenoscyphus albidus]
MDDLNGLDWSATPSANSNKAPQGTGNYYPSIRSSQPAQFPGRTTPLSNQASGLSRPPASSPFAPPKSASPDLFSNLVSFGSSKANTLTLQQQHEKLQAEKRKQEEEKRRQYDAQFGGSQNWESLGNRTQSPALQPTIASQSSASAPKPLPTTFARSLSPAVNSGNVANGGDDDLFAAFNQDTKVDNASFYPPPSLPNSGKSTPGSGTEKMVDLSQPQAWEQPSASLGGAQFGDDDDPFGLGTMKPANSAPVPTLQSADDDDFLGDLGKPVKEIKRRSPAVPSGPPTPSPESESEDPWDKAVAELVDMGFSAEQSRRALTESGSSVDVQAAVGWILNDAHRQAKQKQQSREPSRTSTPTDGGMREPSRNGGRKEQKPSWMREEESRPRREERSPNGEADLSKTAAAVGSSLFKTANSLWKTSQKKVQQAVTEFQQESDPSQPKWMRDAAEREHAEKVAAASARSRKSKSTVPDVTDEALMLESGSRPAPKKGKARYPEPMSSRDQSPAFAKRPTSERVPSAPRWQQSAPSDPRSRLTKQAIEEQSEQAYISPARRKKTPQPVRQPEPEPDLLFASSSIPSKTSSDAGSSRPSPRVTPKPSTPIPVRPKAPPRNIPSLSPHALNSSNEHRLAGTTHFKRGDYAAAHQSYSASLLSIPSSHPIAIILLCNRALTSLKTGIPKSAVSDADTAIELIGPSRGDGEAISLGTEQKDMREFWGKAHMRKAEALEQMEKWREAGEVWKLCVESNVGAATAIQGRTRCKKALVPKPVAKPVSRPPPKPKSALSDLSSASKPDSAAVSRLRAANIEAEKADDEKFALADKVDARISVWRDGKRDNLRALLGSLQDVMWEGSGWTKVGLHELVQNGRVKIWYMKAIGRCHPDKLPQDATMETKMIAALVFATLNESWDKFKQQNGM